MKEQPFIPTDFKDLRLSKRANSVLSTMILLGSAVVNRNFCNFAQKISAYRMMNNDKVTSTSITNAYQRTCKEEIAAAKCKHVLCLQDTCEINYEAHSDRMHKKGRQPGIVSNKEAGCFLHACMAINADTMLPFGFTYIKMWNRDKDAPGCKDRKYRQLDITEKESFRWCEAIDTTESLLGEKQLVTLISDRESDIYDLLTKADKKTKFLIRSCRSRCIDGGKGYLHDKVRSIPSMGTYEFYVPASHGIMARKAQMEVRFTQVEINRPANRKKEDAPPTKINCICVSEVQGTTPKGYEHIEWILLTNHEVKSVEDALRCVVWYRCRWFIEELFRLLKRKGFRVEDIQLEEIPSIEKNILFALYAALMSMTLKHVFNHSDDFVKIPATHCFTSGQVKAMKILMPKIQGKTKKQQNPFPVGSLPWMAWGIARFGCWDCYTYKPGYTTFKSGLDKFAQMHIMYEAMKDVYNG